MTDTDVRLQRLRGDGVAPKVHDARTIAGLTSNPGCPRRSAMDASGTDKEPVAHRLGSPTSIGNMSPFALRRGKSFEAEVTFDGSGILPLLRDLLKLEIEEIGILDLMPEQGEPNARRYRRSKAAIVASANSVPSAATVFDHPLLRLRVSGLDVYLEPDMVAFRVNDRFYVVEIKSWAIIDRVGPRAKVTAAALQSAVYVLALRNLLADAGLDPELVADQVVLVCPKDFTNKPTAELLPVRQKLTVVQRMLDRMQNIDILLAAVPDGVTFDLGIRDGKPTRPIEDLRHAVGQVPARYAPECLATCQLGYFCRDEARAAGHVSVLGRTVREDLGGVENMHIAQQLAMGALPPTPDLEQAAALLRMTVAMRQECLRGVR